LILFVVLPAFSANAGLLSFITGNSTPIVEHSSQNSQNIPLLEASSESKLARGGSDIVVENAALVADSGPADASSDGISNNDISDNPISVYVVKKGDTISTIAKYFNTSVTTIVSANDLKRGKALTEGQSLVILRIPGVIYKVKKGDTMGAIAKKFKVDSDEIVSVNGFDNANSIVAGDEIIIPGVDGVSIEKKAETKKIVQKEKPKTITITDITQKEEVPTEIKDESPSDPEIKPTIITKPIITSSYFIRPIKGGRESQGLHDDNARDLAAPKGTPIMASADGEVVVARGSGYNGGYGLYVVVAHNYNGKPIQTLYAHMSKVVAVVGSKVKQGDVIGYVGSTGKSTGNHVHFSIRGGAKNPNWD